jgi:hypothetical protein
MQTLESTTRSATGGVAFTTATTFDRTVRGFYVGVAGSFSVTFNDGQIITIEDAGVGYHPMMADAAEPITAGGMVALF